MGEGEASTRSIATWVRADRGRAWCARPWRQVTVLSDGEAICACPDVGKTNPLGNVIDRGVVEVWNGEGYARTRRDIEEDIGRIPVCGGCPNRIETPPPADMHDTVPLPKALVIETVGGCNLVCPGCDRVAIQGSRSKLAMTYDDFTRIVDPLSPNLRYMEFYVGGENWAHPRAADMVRYCRDRNPDCFIQTSTNAMFFNTEEKARACVESGIDAVVCSIDGTTQEVYEKGKNRGDLQRVLDGIRRMLRIRAELGRSRPLIIWRYILYRWNSHPEQMDEARRMAREIGVDHLCWHLNADRPELNGERYYIGSPHLHEIEHELWDTLPGRIGWQDPIGVSSYPEAR